MKILILGDVHGQWKAANKLIKRGLKDHPDITHIVQVGDLADHWPKGKAGWTRWNVEQATSLPVHWLDGNHDNHDELEENGRTPNPYLIYQPRGSVLEIDGYRMMFMGGASSIDKDDRLADMKQGTRKIWWDQESITHKQFEVAMAVEGPLHAIFSHDKPDCIETSFQAFRFGMSDRLALQGLLEHFRPPFWFWGHYHAPENGVHEGTQWVQCPEVSPKYQPRYTVWDGEKIELSWKNGCTSP